MNLAPHILAHGNWISMEEFMELALYDPDGGYYNTNIADIGFRGDFSTTATMSDLLARRLVQQWEQSCRAFNRRLPIIEIGGGNGDMAVSMARSLGFFNRLRVRYYMVDRSRALRDLQLMVGGNFVRVYDTIEKALKHAGGRAFIFSNELPDALPAAGIQRFHPLGLRGADCGGAGKLPQVVRRLAAALEMRHARHHRLR